MAKARSRGWAIKGNAGLYNGFCGRRMDAIAEHCSAMYGTDPSVFSALSADQKDAWARCKSAGDRAVKVEMREL